MRVEQLGPGPHHLDPFNCPGCGLRITFASGTAHGTKPANYTDKSPVRMMVCGRCEIVIARWDDKVLALDASAEARLPPEAKASIRETRNDLRIGKALGLKVY